MITYNIPTIYLPTVSTYYLIYYLMSTIVS